MTPSNNQRTTIGRVELPLPLGVGWGEVVLSSVPDCDSAISRTALAAGSSAEPQASALRLIELSPSLKQTTTPDSLQQCAEAPSPSPVQIAPSRYDNPFATCWTKPGAIPFHFTAGVTANQILDRFAATNWRGAIIGPHGSGKSTLLETLKPALVAAGHSLSTITLRDRQPNLPGDFSSCMQALGRLRNGAQSIVIVDGYEQLTWLMRFDLVLHCRRHSLGLLVTSHQRTCLPTLVELRPNLALVEQLVAELCDQVSTRIDSNFVAASHACHGSNVREIFFDLYDRYERIRRDTRTSTRGAS